MQAKNRRRQAAANKVVEVKATNFIQEWIEKNKKSQEEMESTEQLN